MITRRGVTEQAAAAGIEQACRMLRLPTIRDRFGEIAASAEREQEPWIGEGLCPAGERFVGGDRDRRALLPLSQNLKQQLGAAPIQLEIAELVHQDQIDATVAGD